MKTRTALLSASAIMLLGLSGCQSMGQAYQTLYDWDIRGNDASKTPTTSRVAPLVVPPDYALKPAAVAAVRPQDGAGQDQVLDALFGGAAPRSNSERSVVASAGSSETGIRSTVGDPDTNTVNKGSITRDIIAAPEGDGQNAQAAVPE
jgi:hypothetical protein